MVKVVMLREKQCSINLLSTRCGRVLADSTYNAVSTSPTTPICPSFNAQQIQLGLEYKCTFVCKKTHLIQHKQSRIGRQQHRIQINSSHTLTHKICRALMVMVIVLLMLIMMMMLRWFTIYFLQRCWGWVVRPAEETLWLLAGFFFCHQISHPPNILSLPLTKYIMDSMRANISSLWL